MNFRQRIAWLLSMFYIGATFGLFYYIFGISERYSDLAIEHVEQYHNKKDSTEKDVKTSILQRAWNHLMDIPLPIWMGLLFLPYLQVFLMILACTRPQPRLSLAYLWPGLVFLKYQQFSRTLLKTQSASNKNMKYEDTTKNVLNGHVIIDT
ncbi:hypothetical protein ACJMK2_036742 [Sinanodonta woodiana]|uniref:Lysosomal enzyme trafficking factor n=1 Tax=Sinanodonta woodiana TaxID=1069815 RepID=A0ABD3WI48_SINWO